MAVKLYVGMVAVLAAVLGVLTAAGVGGTGHLNAGYLFAFVGLVALTELLQVRYYHHDEVDALNLMEGVVAPLLFVGSGTQVVLVVACGTLLAGFAGRNPIVKTLFNAAQWVLAAAMGSLVFDALVPADPTAPNAMAALALGIIAMSAVNLALIAGVLRVASRGDLSPSTQRGVRGVLAGHVIGHVTSLTVGIALTAAFVWTHWALVIAFIIVLGTHESGRANASVRADSKRLEGLQRATHALATSLDSRQAIPTFLAEARVGFEVQAAQFVQLVDGKTLVHTCTGTVESGYTVVEGQHELAALLSTSLTEPVHLVAGEGDTAVSTALALTGHHRALAVPLRCGTSMVGVLLLLDRVGMEGFESGELSVAAAMGRELVGFLDRVELMHAIDEERRKLADIVESTSDGILTIDSDGVLTSWNSGLTEMTGYAADEMVGTRHFGLLRARDAAGRDVIIERWLDGDGSVSMPAEFQVVTSAGQTLWLSCSYSRMPAAEGRQDVLVVVARNITQARELERLKDDFVAVVSHELRTPLVPIKGWAQTLINRGDRLSDDQRRTAVQSILAQAQKLESLVLNILEASRIESGRADSEGVADVASVVMRIVEDTLSARPDRSVRVRPPSVPCTVRGSAVWVERAVSNLVANAVKYSPDDEPVDVAISVENGDVLVSVTDRGPGIAADAQERIFERFERLEETRKQTGTGLGLYITRRLARAMGGDVTVSSVPGAGSTFLLRLPAAPVVASTRLPEPRQSSDRNVVNLR